jgi:hypothetical protein
MEISISLECIAPDCRAESARSQTVKDPGTGFPIYRIPHLSQVQAGEICFP